ncbi:hypothetical protein [Acinetobacter haemolyticus]|uniref:hypothetical protein n=1 Tax=Acinetobacter haemolyticus TaxID=29430 RepID=UPI002DBF8A94|nr:hypothetical protein [Acinetobacter haemolyticus]MEB6676764.1 hypothetical protein [Acinetobacter haemolyticus]
MKKLIGCILLGMLNNSIYAENCYISMSYDGGIQDIINENYFNFAHYDRVCQQLKQAKAGINITTSSAINERQAVAAAVIQLKDKRFPLLSDMNRSSIWSSPQRTTKEQKALIWEAINEATSTINQRDIDVLNETRKKLGFKAYP